MGVLWWVRLIRWSIVLFGGWVLVLNVSPVCAAPLFQQYIADSDDFVDTDSNYELSYDSSGHYSNAQELELARIESRLERSGWVSRGIIQLAPEKKMAGKRPVGVPVDELDRMLRVVPNGTPLLEYRRISSTFGQRLHPVQKKIRAHNGIDFSVRIGTPVHSTANGIVITAARSSSSGYGKYVVIRHAQGFTTLYAHLNEVEVLPGEFVSKGDLIGKSGNTGKSTGPHLHYEVKYLDKMLDPQRFVEWSSENYLAIFSLETDVPWNVLRKKSTSLSVVEQERRPATNI